MSIQSIVGAAVIQKCGSQEQKDRFIPDLINMKKFSCFAITEKDHGSDATGMTTNARKVEGGYILNGRKKWPGNGDLADITLLWAKNASDGDKI